MTIAVCLLVIVAMEYVVPTLAVRYFETEYRALAVECDQAMHDEAALRPSPGSSAANSLLVLSADVQLLSCHEYDKLRKRLSVLGVSEDRIALLNLEAVEVEQIPVSRMVEPHRMERF
jgi:hypothetical protein